LEPSHCCCGQNSTQESITYPEHRDHLYQHTVEEQIFDDYNLLNGLATMNLEWEYLDPSCPIRQGDLVISRDSSNGRISDMLIVITADCDINLDKFGPHLACLKIISLKSYHETIWAERMLKKFQNVFEAKLLERVRKWHAKQINTNSTMTLSGVMEWLKDGSPEALCDTLEVPDKKAHNLIKAINGFMKGRKICDNESVLPIKRLMDYRLVTDDTLTREQVWKACKDRINVALSDDVFSLPRLPEELNTGPSVVVLRNLESIYHKKIQLGMTEAREGDYLRIARLKPVFKYGLSQAFGGLYSRIGFPNDHDKRHQAAVEAIKTGWEYNYE
jgi:hypothetical protein